MAARIAVCPAVYPRPKDSTPPKKKMQYPTACIFFVPDDQGPHQDKVQQLQK